jgi:SAM-dependent methyltransferase
VSHRGPSLASGSPVDRDARRFFDAVARRYDRVYALSGATSRERLARVLAAIEGRRRVLALGLGTGRELPSLLDAGHDVTGVDVSPEMIAQCNRRSRTVPIAQADFFTPPLPFGDASFDAAIALHGTIAHPPDEGALGRLARQIARVLAPGGVFVAEVPAAEGLAAIAAASASFTVTGPRTFVHHDESAGVALEGVALTAEGWRDALSGPLDVRVEALGAAEHFVVATRR